MDTTTMKSAAHLDDRRAASRKASWAGRILSAIAVLFLLFSASVKLLLLDPALESVAQLGYPERLTFGIGVLELGCTLLYAWPRTSRYGALLLTGYLGGAIATHLRLLHPWLTHTLFPLYVGALVWGGLLLRDRALLDLLRKAPAERRSVT